jgi:hypothetical protein
MAVQCMNRMRRPKARAENDDPKMSAPDSALVLARIVLAVVVARPLVTADLVVSRAV